MHCLLRRLHDRSCLEIKLGVGHWDSLVVKALVTEADLSVIPQDPSSAKRELISTSCLWLLHVGSNVLASPLQHTGKCSGTAYCVCAVQLRLCHLWTESHCRITSTCKQSCVFIELTKLLSSDSIHVLLFSSEPGQFALWFGAWSAMDLLFSILVLDGKHHRMYRSAEPKLWGA